LSLKEAARGNLMKTKNRIFITVLTAALMITAMPKIAVNATSTAK